MKVSTEPIEDNQVLLNVEMETTEIDKYLEGAYKSLAGKVSIPGFRKGKVPRDILEHHLGKDVILQEAIEQLIPEVYNEAINSQGIDAIAQPQIEVVQTEPVTFKAIVPVRPTVKLGDYKEIRLKSEPVTIGEETIEAAIEQIRRQHAVLSPVDRPIQFDDVVTIDIEGRNKGETFLSREASGYRVTKGSPLPLPGFSEQLEGLETGEEKEFVLSFPDDYQINELAGKEYFFKVRVIHINEEKLPELEDKFAETLGSKDVATMREELAADIKSSAEEKARLDFEQKVVDAAVEISEVKYPPVLIERETDQLLSEEARNFTEGIRGLEMYLERISKTMEEHREELRPIASQRIARSLVIEKITEAEGIEITASEVDSEIENMIKGNEQAEELRDILSSGQTRESMRQLQINRKTVERLLQIASGSD